MRVVSGRSIPAFWLWLLLLPVVAAQTPEFPDLREIPPDLETPPVVAGAPAPGRRVRQTLPGYEGTDVHHALYLPVNWKPGSLYPVIVEYAGNGPYKSPHGDFSAGTVEGSNMGFGISGGKDFIWVSMPFVNPAEGKNQRWWWGDTEATVEYCVAAVRRVCEQYGGDPSAVVIAGFSRGAIATNYIGLNNDEIADVWLAFIPYSHYDGVKRWEWPGSDEASALERLRRLNGRATFVSHERSVQSTREYVEGTGVEAPFTFYPIPFRNHNDTWLLRDIPERGRLRGWLQKVLDERPGTHAVHGEVADSQGAPVPGVRIESGPTHWTTTGADGRFSLRGLVNSERILTATLPGRDVTPSQVKVSIDGDDVSGLRFTVGGGPDQGEELIVVGEPSVVYEIPYVNDHAVIYNPGDRKWHMFGIVGDQKRFLHLTADALTQTPWERHEDFLAGDGDKEIWAPHIIRHDGLFYMFYTMIGDPREIRYAVSRDLQEWSHPSAEPLLALTTENGSNRKNKDPMVLRDGDQWVMYFSMLKDEVHWVVGYSTSRDLVSWSDPGICFDEDTESPGVESPFVVGRGSRYYLFLSARPWPVGGVDVFVSETPYRWKPADRVKRIDPWHAPEVVRDLDGRWYLTLSSGTQAEDFRIAPMSWEDGL